MNSRDTWLARSVAVLWAIGFTFLVMSGPTFAEDQYLVGYDITGNVIWTESFADTDYLEVYPPGLSEGVVLVQYDDESCEIIQYDASGHVAALTPLEPDCGTDVLVRESVVYVTNWFEDDDYQIYGLLSAYDLTGDTIWKVRIDGVALSRVEMDSNGDILVRGSCPAKDEYFIAKLDGEGNLVWDWAVAHGEIGGYSSPDWIVLSGGRIVFAGDVSDEESETTVTTTFCLGSDGDEIWQAESGSSSWMSGPRVASDGEGNVYVVNECAVDTGCVVKYDSSGNELWLAEFYYYRYSYEPVLIANQQSGGPVLATSNWTQIDVAAFGSAGVRLWSRQLAGTDTAGDEAYDIATDKDGRIYVTGQYCLVQGYDTTCEAKQLFVVVFDAQGRTIWSTLADGPPSANLPAGEAQVFVLFADYYSQIVLDPDLEVADGGTGSNNSSSDDDSDSAGCGC